VRFEDVLGPPERQLPALSAVADWLGVPVADHLERVFSSALPAVMATETPRRRRWFARAEMLGPILVDPDNLSVMEALGYAADPSTWE
jgi:hypothetical protein